MTTTAITLEPVPYAALSGWADDDHLAAWDAFLASCQPILDAAQSGTKSGVQKPSLALLDTCQLALLSTQAGKPQTRAGAKAFFERFFQPHSVAHAAGTGLLTGYYEPLVKGSRVRDAHYQTPVYKRPIDLVNLVPESERGAKGSVFTHMRQTGKGLVAYPTRAEIEQGALAGQGLELMYFSDPVEVFFMQIQGSARIELPTGEKVRISYDGKNGYPYTSIGRHLIDDGAFTSESMSLQGLKRWLKADRKRAEPVMWKNQSYVFFRELAGSQAESAMGVLHISLQPGRSLAVDTAFHAIGTPIYVSSPTLTHAVKGKAFNRLMVAQDVGSAIKGAERGDIYFGSGDQAGRTAGITKHPGKFYVLVARDFANGQTVVGDTTGRAP